MIAQPKTKAVELISDIKNFGLDDRQNQILLHKYKKQAKEYLAKDPCGFSIVLGVLSTLERNLDEMHHWFKQAMRVSPGSSVSVRNYAISLGHLGYYADAVKLLTPVYEKDQSNLELLDCLIVYQMSAGSITDAYNSIQKWMQLCSTPHWLTGDLECAVRVLQLGGYSDSDVESLRQTTIAPLQQRNVFIGTELFMGRFDEENAWIQYDIIPDVVGDAFREVEQELDDILENSSSSILDYVEVLYTDPEIDNFVEKLRGSDKSSSFHEIVPISEEQMKRIAGLVGECYS
jgi:tetratricopeptide (TPR) repeat protein